MGLADCWQPPGAFISVPRWILCSSSFNILHPGLHTRLYDYSSCLQISLLVTWHSCAVQSTCPRIWASFIPLPAQAATQRIPSYQEVIGSPGDRNPVITKGSYVTMARRDGLRRQTDLGQPGRAWKAQDGDAAGDVVTAFAEIEAHRPPGCLPTAQPAVAIFSSGDGDNGTLQLDSHDDGERLSGASLRPSGRARDHLHRRGSSLSTWVASTARATVCSIHGRVSAAVLMASCSRQQLAGTLRTPPQLQPPWAQRRAHGRSYQRRSLCDGVPGLSLLRMLRRQAFPGVEVIHPASSSRPRGVPQLGPLPGAMGPHPALRRRGAIKVATHPG